MAAADLKIIVKVDQKKLEREVFEEFCWAASLDMAQGSFEQAPPPAPDVFVDLVPLGKVAFELVEISPSSEIRNRATLDQVIPILLEHIDRLHPDLQKEFDRKYSNATLHVSLMPMRGSKEINAVMPWVVATLQNLPSSFEGSVKEVSAYYPDDLLSMYVVREPHTKGPLFQAIGIGGAPPANLDALARKRSKVYQTDRPLHLLAWLGSRQVLQDPDGERLLREIEEILCHSKFACIWIFERGRNGVARYERH